MVNASIDRISGFQPSISVQTDAYSAVDRTIGSPLSMINDVSAIESQTHQS